MIRSMTGYGRNRRIIGEYEITAELRAVNNRYFEFSAKLPRSYQYLEDKIKLLLKEQISRGKVDFTLSVYNVQGKEAAVSVNNLVVEGYVKALRETGERFGLPDDLTLNSIFKMTDAFHISRPEEDEEAIWAMVKETTAAALDNFMKMRETEGEKMKEDVLEKLTNIERMTEEICTYSAENITAYRNRLTEKMKNILADQQIDESRILLEAGIFAEKTAVDEETVRLKSHFLQLRTMLDTAKEPIGRKLDFLIQEINREVNTVGSKAQELRITKIVIDAKNEIEKIREQIQNIE